MDREEEVNESQILALENANSKRLDSLDDRMDRLDTKMDSMSGDISFIKNALQTRASKSNGPSSDASWTRQSIGIVVALLTLIGILIPTFNSMIAPFEMQLSYQNTEIKRLWEEIKHHEIRPWHETAAVKLAEHDKQFKTVDRDTSLVIEEIKNIRAGLSEVRKETNSELGVLNEKVSWTEQEIIDDNERERQTYHKRIIEGDWDAADKRVKTWLKEKAPLLCDMGKYYEGHFTPEKYVNKTLALTEEEALEEKLKEELVGLGLIHTRFYSYDDEIKELVKVFKEHYEREGR